MLPTHMSVQNNLILKILGISMKKMVLYTKQGLLGYRYLRWIGIFKNIFKEI